MKNNIELPKNHMIFKINNIDELDIQGINEKSEMIKVIINLFNIDQIKSFNSSKILEQNNIHISLICSNQIFKMLNLNSILNNSIMKNITVDNFQTTINFYLQKSIDENIFINNMKITETIRYNSGDFEIKSKIHEVLYHANTILKTYKKQNDQVGSLKNKIDRLNNYSKKL